MCSRGAFGLTRPGSSNRATNDGGTMIWLSSDIAGHCAAARGLMSLPVHVYLALSIVKRTTYEILASSVTGGSACDSVPGLERPHDARWGQQLQGASNGVCVSDQAVPGERPGQQRTLMD